MGFLGVDISPEGFEMELVKVEMVHNWKPPKTVCMVWDFVGFCNFYQCFIKSFSEIACPLHDLTKQGQKWQWTENEQYTFDTLKEMICQLLVLIHADPTKKFQMKTDALNYAYGVVSSQKSEDQQFHPVVFYSKSMNPAEWNYGISDKEALPIIKGLQYGTIGWNIPKNQCTLLLIITTSNISKHHTFKSMTIMMAGTTNPLQL